MNNQLVEFQRTKQKRLASPGLSAKIDQRNYYSQFKHDFKPITKTNFISQTYHENFNQINRDFSKSQFFDYQNQINDKNNNRLNHIQNFRLEKSKNYADSKRYYGGQEGELKKVQGSELISQSDFRHYRSVKNNDEIKQNDNRINLQLKERNLYMTRQYLKLNEFEKQAPITNVAIVSKDNLNWIADTNSKYSNLGNTKLEIKKQQKLLANKDILGNEKIKPFFQEKKFVLQHPGVSLKSELKRMHPVDNDQRNTQRNFSIQELKQGQVNVNWPEQLNKQSYDKFISTKIGNDNKPFIKTLDAKRNNLNQITSKISRNDIIYQPENVEKKTQLKIGHGKPEVLTYKA